MYHALYLTDGTLVGVTNSDPVALPSVSVIQLDSPPLLDKCIWNSETLSFDINSTTCSKLDFMTRFTISERLAAKASSDPVVADFLELLTLAEFIDTSDPNTIAGVNYLAYAGIISQSRIPDVLA